jgi:hypothetical protein
MRHSLRHVATHRITLLVVLIVALLLIVWNKALSAQPCRENDADPRLVGYRALTGELGTTDPRVGAPRGALGVDSWQRPE